MATESPSLTKTDKNLWSAIVAEALAYLKYNAYAHRDHNLIIAWPTKLTLAPDLGDRVMALVEENGLTPGEPLTIPAALEPAPMGVPYWHRCF